MYDRAGIVETNRVAAVGDDTRWDCLPVALCAARFDGTVQDGV